MARRDKDLVFYAVIALILVVYWSYVMVQRDKCLAVGGQFVTGFGKFECVVTIYRSKTWQNQPDPRSEPGSGVRKSRKLILTLK